VTLIMTSNAGAREIAGRAIGFVGGRAGDGRKEIERLFSPEFRNRLDEIVSFAPLPPEVMGRVVDKFVREVEEQLRERKITLELDAGARRWLAEKGYDADFGARPLARVIQTELKDRLADDVLFGPLAKGGRVRVTAADGALRFEVLPPG
jgi:ATP-dependent Clp protease ATP-binding subunit ClpA